MSTSPAATAGVINPYALVEARLGRAIAWGRVADRRRFLATALGVPYERLFDPRHESPLYAHVAFDANAKKLVPRAREKWLPELLRADLHAIAVGAYAMPTVAWRTAGTFFTHAPDFTAPVQGALPDCHFISAMAALAWSDPFAFQHIVRPSSAADRIGGGGTLARAAFYAATGGSPAHVEVSERLPLLEPGDHYQYARSGHGGETWPAVYEKAWVKWFTGDPGDAPDYGMVTGGDPVADLVHLTGRSASYVSTTSKTGDQIWDDVRGHCRGSWTFHPLVACTYASASAAPTTIDYAAEGLVAWHCYAILGWQFAGGQKYLVLRNPWGYHEATRDVDNGPWTSFDQFEGGNVVGTLDLPTSGVFALRADVFQRYFVSYGWVS